MDKYKCMKQYEAMYIITTIITRSIILHKYEKINIFEFKPYIKQVKDVLMDLIIELDFHSDFYLLIEGRTDSNDFMYTPNFFDFIEAIEESIENTEIENFDIIIDKHVDILKNLFNDLNKLNKSK